MDLRPGQRVLDVAAGNGNATLAAARRWGNVTSTDYVPALLERGCAKTVLVCAVRQSRAAHTHCESVSAWPKHALLVAHSTYKEAGCVGLLFDIHGTRVIDEDPADLYLGTDNGKTITRAGVVDRTQLFKMA